ncbi:hypothetical protein [Paenisporosarcina sp. NPDC076898]|uniref:hypothetical protein n=1 Tax=unclassified Paenisporosarcina TaxID=2642018 RepID=UPI003CFFCA9D
MKIKDLTEFKAQKNGEITPSKLLESIQALIDSGEVESIICMIQTKNGDFHSGWNSDSKVVQIGLAEVLKTHLLDSMRDWG